MEVLRRGTSRMDAARGVMGQGRSMYAGPRMQGRILFGYFLLCEARESNSP